MMDHSGLPQPLLNVWHFDDDELLTAIRGGALKDITVSSLLKSHLEPFIHRNDAEESRTKPVPSLKSLAIGTILRVLDSADDLHETARYIVSNLDNDLLQDFLTDHRMRYPILRVCIAAAKDRVPDDRDFIDIDQAIQYNALYIAGRDVDNCDSAYLITLDDFRDMLPTSPGKEGYMRLARQKAPEGGLKVLDAKRNAVLQIPASSAAFANHLKEVAPALQFLDWKNVLLAGESVMKILLHGKYLADYRMSSGQDSSDDNEHRANRPRDLRLCIYGLSMEEAKAKLDEIHAALGRALSTASMAMIAVVKTAVGVSFLLSHPEYPIHLDFKLYKNPTEVLQRQELDQYKLGFDGHHVIMLPSCARALETGYMVFKMSAMIGCHCGGLGGTLDRFVEQAYLGFGLRIMPYYMKILGNSCEVSDVEVRSSSRPQAFTALSSFDLDMPGVTNSMRAIDMFFQHDGAWQLRSDQRSYYHGPNSPLVDELPSEHFPHSSYDPIIDDSNTDLFLGLQEAICYRLQMPIQRNGYAGYLTRRIRRQIYDSTYDFVQRKQIIIPLIIPPRLDTYICDIVDSLVQNRRPLLRVHDPSRHDPQTSRLPSLQDDASNEKGKIRYWLITNDSVWAGQHPVLDEISEKFFGAYLDGSD